MLSYFKLAFNEEHLIRVVTNPYQYYVHPDFKHKETNDKFKCTLFTSNSDCEVCKLGSQVIPEWITGITSEGNSYLLKMGNLLYNSICESVKTHGDPFNYDLRITRYEKNYDILSLPGLILNDPNLKNLIRNSCMIHFARPPRNQKIEDFVKRK